MIELKDELEYLENIDISGIDIPRKSKEIKDFIYELIEKNSFDEIYETYLAKKDKMKISFPRIEHTYKNKLETNLEKVKTKIVICGIDRILESQMK